MLYGLQAGFGGWLGRDLDTIRALGFDGVRLDVQDMEASFRADLVREATTAGLIPFSIVRDATQMDGVHEGMGVHVEIRSEPDIWPDGISPHDYRMKIEAAYAAAKERGLQLWAGTVSNLNERGLHYLEQLHPRDWPEDLPVSVHWYPHGGPTTPHPGFRSRDAEVETLVSIIGERAWGVSEFGYHTGRRWCLGVIPRRWTDDEVARFTEFEFKFWRRHGARFAVLYQWNDGYTDDALGRYGIRRTDGTLKPVAHVVGALQRQGRA